MSGEVQMNPGRMSPLPAEALEADIERLHLRRGDAEHLRAREVATIGDLVDGGYLSRRGWDALGRSDGKAVWEVVRALSAFSDAERVDWDGFWASRGVAVVPRDLPDAPNVGTLVGSLPSLLKAALADGGRGVGEPERAWVIIDGRNGLVSKPKTLDELGNGVLGVTRERVRQIEGKAMLQLRQAWDVRFHGTSYRINEALEPVLAAFAHACAEVEGPVAEADLLVTLGLPPNPPARDLPLVAFMLDLGGLQRFPADGDRRQAMWAPLKHASAGPRISLADRLGHLLTEDLTEAVTAADITAALNRGADGQRVALRDVEGALALSPLVEQLEDGRWRGRFEYLARRADQAFRIIDEAGGPVELREVVREINARARQKPVTRASLSNQLAGDERFAPVGRSGYWGLAERDAAAAATIPELMIEVLHRAGRPMSAEEIDAAVRARRPVGENSVAIYLATRREFVRLPDKAWALASWPEAVAQRGKARVPRLGERIAEVAIPYLRAAPAQEARLNTLAHHVAGKLGVSPDNVYPYFTRHPAFSRVVHGGQIFVRLSSSDPEARVRFGRKSKLAVEMAAVLVPFLESAPGHERELGEVVRHVTATMGVIPATVYAYVKRIPGVERVDEGDRKLVRLVDSAHSRTSPSAGRTPPQ